ncbi:hypothetical protein [Paractinoplanes deccanensis]|uniref:hypothetical protein n=1 Tax=Paractinoplanes deccanensis TaxID=113561 RepID=UPI001941EEB9|nr:hypothetical protein [Actinoplanes deccanensis]
MSYPVQPSPIAVAQPPSPAGRPPTVTVAAVLLWVMALVGLIYAIATLAVVPGTLDRFRAVTEGPLQQFPGDTDPEYYVAVVWLGAAVALALAVIVFALYVVLGLALRRGSNVARIATLVACVLGILGGAASALTVAVQRGGDTAPWSLGAKLSDAYPGGWIGTNAGLAVAQILGYAVVGVLVLTAPKAFFRKPVAPAAPGVGVPPGGYPPAYGAPYPGYPAVGHGPYAPAQDQQNPYGPAAAHPYAAAPPFGTQYNPGFAPQPPAPADAGGPDSPYARPAAAPITAPAESAPAATQPAAPFPPTSQPAAAPASAATPWAPASEPSHAASTSGSPSPATPDSAPPPPAPAATQPAPPFPPTSQPAAAPASAATPWAPASDPSLAASASGSPPSATPTSATPTSATPAAPSTSAPSTSGTAPAAAAVSGASSGGGAGSGASSAASHDVSSGERGVPASAPTGGAEAGVGASPVQNGALPQAQAASDPASAGGAPVPSGEGDEPKAGQRDRAPASDDEYWSRPSD